MLLNRTSAEHFTESRELRAFRQACRGQRRLGRSPRRGSGETLFHQPELVYLFFLSSYGIGKEKKKLNTRLGW